MKEQKTAHKNLNLINPFDTFTAKYITEKAEISDEN